MSTPVEFKDLPLTPAKTLLDVSLERGGLVSLQGGGGGAARGQRMQLAARTSQPTLLPRSD